MINHVIPKPMKIEGYQLHRMVAELVNGFPAQFVDNGDHLLIRTNKPITSNGKEIKTPEQDAVIAFELKASVVTRIGRKNIYPEINDWRIRREWLVAEGLKGGFEILAIHVTGDRQNIIASDGRKFWIDSTQFTGILKVVEKDKFSNVLADGIGRVGKAFGMGMLVI